VRPIDVNQLELLLLNRKWFASDAGKALAILSGGIPRELIRMAELVAFEEETTFGGFAGETALDWTVVTAIRVEAFEFRQQVVSSEASNAHGALTPETRVSVYQALADDLFDPSETQRLRMGGDEFVRRYWEPPWQDDPAWQEPWAELWRRLLVQVRVATQLLKDDADAVLSTAETGSFSNEKAQTLQIAIARSCDSGTVAMLLLDARMYGGTVVPDSSSARH
jgi:hypothetical protein